jgi:hypothetical protein
MGAAFAPAFCKDDDVPTIDMAARTVLQPSLGQMKT